jgi:hypothetical protein
MTKPQQQQQLLIYLLIYFQHVTLMAAAKLGMQITDMDSKINTVAEVRECLALAQCRMIVFDPQSEGVDRLELLRMSIPEFYHCKSTRNY